MKSPISRFTVNGNSMVPTLCPGQDVLSFNWAYLGKRPKVGDIVVVRLNGKDVVKRVNNVYDRTIYLLSDNSQESTDSRDFGPVGMDQVIGKVVYRSGQIPCPQCNSPIIGIYGRKDAICSNCGFKLACCGDP